MGCTFLKVQILSAIFKALFWEVALAEIYRIPLRRRSVATSKAEFAKSVTGNVTSLPYDVELYGKPGEGYYTTVEIGTPPQTVNILVDTGSANFAVSASASEELPIFFNTMLSSTYQDLGTEVSVMYTQGNWKGHLGSDVISIPGLPKIQSIRTKIALITSSSNFFINGSGWQGIFGLGYSDIARPDSSVLPFFDAAVKASSIPNEFCMLLCGTIDTPHATDTSMGGTLVIGGVDPSLYAGELYYTPIRREWYYEVILTDIGVAGLSLGMDCLKYNTDKSIVDSGTTNFRLPSPVFDKVVREIKSRTSLYDRVVPQSFWEGKVVMCFNETQRPFYGFPSLYLDLAEDVTNNQTSIRLHITAQQYLRAVGDEVETDKGMDCYKFAISGSAQGTVIGAVIMEGFFVHFDRANKRVGFGNSTCVVRDPLYRAYVSRGHNFTTGNTSRCGYIKPHHFTSLQIAAFVIAGITAACFIPLAGLAVHWLYTKFKGKLRADTGHRLIEQQGDEEDTASISQQCDVDAMQGNHSP